MNRPRNLTEEEAIRARVLVEEGYSRREIGRRLGVHHSTIGRALQRFQETGSDRRRRGQGRPRCTSERDDRFLKVSTLRTTLAELTIDF